MSRVHTPLSLSSRDSCSISTDPHIYNHRCKLPRHFLLATETITVILDDFNDKLNQTELKSSRAHQTRGEQDIQGNRRNWKHLTPILVKRSDLPGLGHYGGRIGSDEMFQLPWNDDDTVVWTHLIEALTPRFGTTFLVNLNNRIISVGE